MLDTKKAHELDIVELTEDLPEYGLQRGARGTVVEVFDEPEEAYMLEFVDESGTSSTFADWVKASQITNIDAIAEEAFERGITFFNNGEIGEAEKSFKLSIELNPRYKTKVRNVVQDSFGNKGDWEEAIRPLRLLLRIDPADMDSRDSLAIAWLNCGVQNAREGNISQALVCFRRAAALDPSPDVLSILKDNIAIAYRQLGIQAYERGALKDTQYYMSQAFMLSPNKSTRRNLGIANAYLAHAYLKKRKYRAALVFFEAAEDAGLMSPELLNNYGVALAYEDRLDEANAAFEKAQKLKTGADIILGNLAKLRNMVSAADFITEELKTEFVPLPAPREYSRAA